MRRAVPLLLAVAVIAIVVIGLTQASSDNKTDVLPAFDVDQALTELDGAPAPLTALHAQHGQLLGGGTKALHARIKALKGHPIVLNKWGSWCPPCRQEFPIFQHASADLGKQVAFVGIDAVDPQDAARKFLREKPLTYPSYRDPRGTVSESVGAPGGSPITVFIDRRGHSAYVHQGQYQTLAALKADIKRYLRV